MGHSGVSLWSISQRLLAASATPQQIYNETARICALNCEQIGQNPNLTFADQRLPVPPAVSGHPAFEPSASGWSAGATPPARVAAEAASAGHQVGRQAKRGTFGAPRQKAAKVGGEDSVTPNAAFKPAPLADAARAAPIPAAMPLSAEEPPRSPGESFVGEVHAATAAATSTVAGPFPRWDHTWRELLGAALLAVSSVAVVFAVAFALALLLAPGGIRRSQRGRWWREVHANDLAYDRCSFDLSPDPFSGEGLEGGRTGAHAHTNSAHANGKVAVGMILAAERNRGRFRRRGRLGSLTRHMRRHARRGLAHGVHNPGIEHQLRGVSGTRLRGPASCASAASRGRLVAEAGRTEVGDR